MHACGMNMDEALVRLGTSLLCPLVVLLLQV